MPVIASLVALLSFAATLLPAGVTRGPRAGGIAEYRLPNGLKVLIRPDYARASIGVTVHYGVGWYDERAGERGVAHLLEHLAFTGTTGHPRPRREIAAHGADASAATTAEATQYSLTIPPTGAALRWAVDFEADRMRRLVLDPAVLDAQRRIVLTEVGRGEPSLDARVRSAAFDYSRYANRGQNADLATLTMADVRAFYARHYRPANAALAIDGPVDESAALAIVAAAFARVPLGAPGAATVTPAEPPQRGERAVLVTGGGAPRVVAAYHAPPLSHPDAPAVELLLRAITAPEGRVRRALSATTVASSVRWATSLTRHPDLATVAVVPSSDSVVEQVRDALRRSLDDVVARPLSDDEIERGRPRSPPAAITAAAAADCEIAGDWRLCLVRDRRLAAVAPDDVRRAARTYLLARNRTVGVLVATRDTTAAAPIADGDAAAVIARAGALPDDVATGERLVPTVATIAARTVTTTLPSGLRVALLPKRTSGATVDGVLSLDFGDESSLIGRVAAGEVVSRLLGAAIARGGAEVVVASRPRPTRVVVEPFVDLTERSLPYRGTGVDVRFRTDRAHLDTVLGVIAATLRTPTFDESELAALQRQQAALARDRATATNADYTFDALFPALPSDHPERALSAEERAAAIARVTIDDVRRFHADFYGASSGVLAVVGDFAADSVAARAGALFGEWRNRVAPRGTLSRRRDVVIDSAIPARGGASRGVIASGQLLSIGADDPDFAAMVIANAILGGGVDSRLFDRIRETEGLSYSVASRLRPRVGESLSLLVIEASYELEHGERVRTLVREEVDRALRVGFTADEVSVATRGYLARALIRRGNDASLAQELTASTPAQLVERERRIAALTPAAVSAAFRRHVTPSAMTTVRVVRP